MQIETLISLNKDINIDKIISSKKIDLVEKLYRQGYKDLMAIKKKLRDEFNFEMNLSEIRIAVANLSHKNSIE